MGALGTASRALQGAPCRSGHFPSTLSFSPPGRGRRVPLFPLFRDGDGGALSRLCIRPELGAGSPEPPPGGDPKPCPAARFRPGPERSHSCLASQTSISI